MTWQEVWGAFHPAWHLGVFIVASQAIGLIGLGLLGSALAERFLAAGTDVVGLDIEAERCANLQRLGGEVAESSVAIARGCRRIVFSLPTSETVDEVLADIEHRLRLRDPSSSIPPRETPNRSLLSVPGWPGAAWNTLTLRLGDRVSR